MSQSEATQRRYAAVTPYIMVRHAERVLDFVTEVLGAEIVSRNEREDGRLGHSEFRIRDSVVMLSDVGEEWPEATGAFYVYVPDVDAAYRKALEAGASSIMEPADQEYGDRHGGVLDMCGNQWWLAAPIEGGR